MTEAGAVHSVAGDTNESNESVNEETTEKNKERPLQVSVTEKVIFCIDASVLFHVTDNGPLIEDISDILHLFMELKREISIGPVEFQCLLIYDDDRVFEIDISLPESLQRAMSSEKSNSFKETEEFDFNVLFTYLAKNVELSPPEIFYESIPPHCVYHCVLFFGRNMYVPTMKETNAFDFLIQSPFFAFDTIYLYNNYLLDNMCEQIGNVLYGLYEYINGYFLWVNSNAVKKQYGEFAKLLGHPLIRPPQSKAMFNLKELCSHKPVNN